MTVKLCISFGFPSILKFAAQQTEPSWSFVCKYNNFICRVRQTRQTSMQYMCRMSLSNVIYIFEILNTKLQLAAMQQTKVVCINIYIDMCGFVLGAYELKRLSHCPSLHYSSICICTTLQLSLQVFALKFVNQILVLACFNLNFKLFWFFLPAK